MDINLLKKLGFSDKMAKIYLVLLGLGPSSVRKLAESSGLNRGIIYEVLKDLQEKGVVKYYKEETKQLFVAEDPDRLRDLIHKQERRLREVENNLDKFLPELHALYNPGGDRPIAKYFNQDEIRLILEDVLETCENFDEKEYLVYSVEGLREDLYKDFATFSDVRIAKGINVKAIAIGLGGELRGLDERRWIEGVSQTPTYIIIYPGKTAYISLDAKKELVGVVIENEGVYETQKIVFNNLWEKI
jgi:HTH-type transcriptional regulator, sugar sensing transcriptional regulator